jgi:hypothetical protein
MIPDDAWGHMAPDQLAILPDVTHYDIFPRARDGQNHLALPDRQSCSKSWTEEWGM